MPQPDDLSAYQAAPDLLKGKNILVTGAGAGIGRAAALSFAQHGATVILLGKTESHLSEVYDAIEANGDPQPAIVPFDLATIDESAYEDIALQLQNNLGGLDGVLHNAGILGELKPLEQYDGKTFADVLNVNLLSNFLLTKALMPSLKAAENASVIFTSSSVGRQGRAYWGAYAVAKFGIEGLMQIWADELESTSSIRVNSLNPCGTSTAMRRQAYPAENPSSTPQPAAIMGAYLFLMGDDSIHINGQQLDARIR